MSNINKKKMLPDHKLVERGYSKTLYEWEQHINPSRRDPEPAVITFTEGDLPMAATSQLPPQGAINVGLASTISWANGGGATSYDVRFGTVNPPPFIQNQAGTTYNPGPLVAGTIYYYRIDAKNSRGTTAGAVFTFTSLAFPGQATSPSPANPGLGVNKNPTLSWTPGANNPTSHKVYFGTANPPTTLIGTQAGTTYTPSTLTPGTTYFWQINEINAAGETFGQVWRFTVLAVPAQATIPSPANAATGVSVAPTLNWTAGARAVSHNVYLGTNQTNVTNATTASAEYKGNQAGTTYDAGTLVANTTYYWRIDEVNTSGVTAGTVWSFATVTTGNVGINGLVTDRLGNPPGTQIVMSATGTGASAGVNRSSFTIGNGTYNFNVPSGWTGTITGSANVSMNPQSYSLTNVTADQFGKDFKFGTNYHVAKTGNDNTGTGTLASPWLTIVRANGSMLPGDAVVVHVGTYAEQITVSQSGQSGLPRTFRNYPGESPILNGTGSAGTIGFLVDTMSYITIDGFEIKNYDYGIYLVNDANFCIIRNNNIHLCVTNNIYLRGADYFLVEYNELHHCQNAGVSTNWRDTTSNFAQFGMLSHNVVHDNGSFSVYTGADGMGGPGALNCIWEYNVVYNNADDGIDISSSSGGGNTPMNAIVRYNACFLNGIDPATGLPGAVGAGNGLKVATNTGGGHLVHHNICFKNKRGGIDQDMGWGWPGNSYYNNVAWKNGIYAGTDIRGGFIIEGGGLAGGSIYEPGRSDLKNNIGFGNDPSNLAGFNNREDFFTHKMGIGVSDYNLWGAYHYVADPAPDPGHDTEGVHSIIGSDPLFVNPDGVIDVNYVGSGGPAGKWAFIYNQVLANFALQAGSPCIDKGVHIPGITDGYLGAAPDMGAIEKA